MNRDVGYALLAALSLSALTALWALVNAPSLASPKEAPLVRGNGGSVPVLPRRPDNSEALERAVAVLDTRDLFSATAPADMASLRRLSKAQIAPPVELTPVEDTPRIVQSRQQSAAVPAYRPAPVYRPAPPVPQQAFAPPLPQAPPPPPTRQEPTQRLVPPPTRPAPPAPAQTAQVVRDQRFPLTLRGVFPNPRTGGRAHVALPNGQIVSTGPGGVIEGFYVLQINAASIIVQGRGGPALRLEMPGY